MHKQHFVKVREDAGRFMVYWFMVESKRSYGGRIISISHDYTNAMEHAHHVAQRHGTQVIVSRA